MCQYQVGDVKLMDLCLLCPCSWFKYNWAILVVVHEKWRGLYMAGESGLGWRRSSPLPAPAAVLNVSYLRPCPGHCHRHLTVIGLILTFPLSLSSTLYNVHVHFHCHLASAPFCIDLSLEICSDECLFLC